MKRIKQCSALLSAFCLTVALCLPGCGRAPAPESSAPAPVPDARPATEEELRPSYELTVISSMDVMCEPRGILPLEDGSFLVTDTYNNAIWKVENGVSTLYAGSDTVTDPYDRPMGGYNDAAPVESHFKDPWAIAPFLDGYAVSDSSNGVVRLVRDESVHTVNGVTGSEETVPGLDAVFRRPTGLAADEKGSLYVSDTLEGAVLKITPEGEVSTFTAGLSEPMGLCWKKGTLYIAETGANRVVSVTGGGQPVTVAGSGEEGLKDGPAAQAAFSAPQGVAADESGVIYISDTANSAVRMVRDGVVTTIAQRDVSDLAAFIPSSPVGLMIQGDALYVCDSFARRVFAISLLPAASEETAQPIRSTAAPSATAASVQLIKTEGTVAVTNSSGRELSLRDNMLLYNGYHISTQASSYAWINLDSEKLTKLDQASEAEVHQSGKVLEVMLNSGAIFFNVTKPLAQDETLNIRTATMVVGIRGTSGWVRLRDRWSAEICVLEGQVECSVSDPVTGQVKSASIQGGQKAVAATYPPDWTGDRCDIVTEQFEPESIDGFVLMELAGDAGLCDLIYERSGLDVQAAAEAAQERLEQAQQEMRQQLDSIQEQLVQQDKNISTGMVWERDDSVSASDDAGSAPADDPPAVGSSASGSDRDDSSRDRDDSSSAAGNSAAGGDLDDSGKDTLKPVVTLTMPVTAAQVQEYLETGSVTQVILQPGSADSSLSIDIQMTVPSGKILTAQSGVSLAVEAGGSLTVDGTVIGPNLSSQGAINNTAGGRIAAAALNTSGTLTNAGRIDGPVIASGGSLVMTGGSVNADSQTAVQLENGADLQMSGGVINSEVYLRDRSSFTMTGGTVNGGEKVAVVVEDQCAFTMDGGTVTDNVTLYNGSTFILNGGELISSLHSALYAGDVTKLELNAGAITQNAAGGFVMTIRDAALFTGAYQGTILRSKNTVFLENTDGEPLPLIGYVSSLKDDGYYHLEADPGSDPGSGTPESDTNSGSDPGSESDTGSQPDDPESEP